MSNFKSLPNSEEPKWNLSGPVAHQKSLLMKYKYKICAVSFMYLDKQAF